MKLINHWAYQARLNAMRWARETDYGEIRAHWVMLARKYQAIYLADRRINEMLTMWKGEIR